MAISASCALVPLSAQAQQMGAPPPDAKAAVEAPKAAADRPKIEDKLDGTTATVSAGGMQSTGNSRMLAGTANGMFETRFTGNAISGSALGNYGKGAPAGQPQVVNTENYQLRVRYDRYIVEQASFFLINTGRYDRFQGLDFRYNLDPGFKYIFWQAPAGAFWGEGGYDLQHDVRRGDARYVLDANGNRVIDPTGLRYVRLDKTQTDHSLRLFAGFRYAFNADVTLTTGIEYLQSFVHTTRNRVNFDALIAAKIGGGLSLGAGFTARYNHDPLPGKEELDTSTTLNLIYAFSDLVAPPKPPPCPVCPPPPPAPEPAAAPPAAPTAPAASPAAASPAAASPAAPPPAAAPSGPNTPAPKPAP
jgi:putative salt-induced outer membrane protein YdiY